MPRVHLPRRVPVEGLDPLRAAGHHIDMRDADAAPARSELLDAVRGAAALIPTLSERVDDELLDAAGPELRVVANFAVGVDNVDLDACRSRGVAVANTPDVLTGATADQAMALLLAVARRVIDGHRLVASGRWEGWAPLQMLGRDVEGSTVGVVGPGRIGSAFARRAAAFGMRVLYAARSRHPELERELGAERAELHDLLRRSDVVSLHAPLTPETRHLIGRRELGLMRDTSILVNTARGALIDEEALVEALRDGRLWGAGLDVFEDEPRLSPGLAELPNVVLAPHLGSATPSVRTAMARLASEAVVAVLAGRDAPNLVVRPAALGRAADR